MFVSYLLTFINILIIICSLRVASNRLFLSYSGVAINPVVFVSFIQSFFVLDFYFLYSSQIIDFFETSFVVTTSDIDYSFFVFTCFNFTYLLAVFFASLTSSDTKKSFFKFNVDSRAAGFSFYSVVLFCIMIALLNYDLYMSMFSGQISRQILFSSNPLYHVVYSLALPTFAMYAATHQENKNNIVIAYIATLVVVFLSGSRGNVILATIIFGISILPVFRRLKSYYLFIAIPFLATFLLVSRYYLREIWYYPSIVDFINDYGGVGQVFIKSTEVSMAEVLVTISIWEEQILRAPFESFIAGFMYPLPRSIFEFKPMSPGGVLTDLLSPTRWELTRSEIVTTGYGDLLMQFGGFYSYLVFFVCIYFWCKLVIKTARSSTIHTIYILPFLIWWPYIFMRGDLFNMFGNLWSFFLAILLYKISAFILKVKI